MELGIVLISALVTFNVLLVVAIIVLLKKEGYLTKLKKFRANNKKRR